jgi:hypothetical protein
LTIKKIKTVINIPKASKENILKMINSDKIMFIGSRMYYGVLIPSLNIPQIEIRESAKMQM